MKLGSLFDGSGGFPLAGALCGIEPVWASEIEAYPIAVTTQRFPRMKHLGDITKIDGGKIEPVDAITLGSPCQDLSIAGKRAGIHEGARSSLLFHAVRIIKEMREATNGVYPRIVIWENVHGAFSSNGGEDFRAVLKAICEIAEPGVDIPRPEMGKWNGAGCIVGDGYSVAWRTYDAQYWGVPQRRRRIYLVADLGSERAGEILFEQEGVRGNSAQGIPAREAASVHAAGGAGRGGCAGGNVTCYAIGSYASNAWKSPNQDSGVYVTEVAKTLDLNGGNPSCNQGRTCVVALDCRNMVGNAELSGTLQAKNEGGFSLNFINPVVYDCRGNGGGGVAPTLTGDHENRVTDYTALCVGNGQVNQISMAEQSNTLDCMHDQQIILSEQKKQKRRYIIRRLTPMECCRLQGFPDWWTEGCERYPISMEHAKNKTLFLHVNPTGAIEGADRPKYKMWGNGIALPCAMHVMQGVARKLEERA